MPELQRLYDDYAERGLVVLYLSNESRDALADWLAARPMTTVQGRTDEIPWPIFGWPTTFVVDREGRLRETMNGPRTYEQFARVVEGLL